MAFAYSWIAVHGLDRAAVLKRLELTPTGGTDTSPPAYGQISVCDLADGWTMVALGDMAHDLGLKDSLAKLSIDCRLVAAHIEERAMFSSAEEWRQGRQLWQVQHDQVSSRPALETTGNPPGDFAALKKSHAGKVFDVPLQLARSITGFKHDDATARRYELLDWRSEPAKPWWKFW
jgi:hypothetical protein